ncbi:DUF3800 domain-containing protein [Magnetofaba australis]|uniref:DUF3800 domain-containing protein n=1 Tax=Magnetofaba australis IT-1 TaxID=1434232 RepID=A0A1Y2K7L8_9PROT|nr:DUF3800 domain-containing protein [Magnetofaba australis]OSM06751.1 hypothetical protein MAIT1_00392 [Magnetofaba australis IT-1]
MLYIAYLDEFGHDGQFVSRSHLKYNTSPVFGFGGIVLPWNAARPFGSWFYQRKNELLDWEIKRSGEHPGRWEKKGASLYTSQNIHNYPELRRFTFRLLNKIHEMDGYVFYSGVEKYMRPEEHKTLQIYIGNFKKSLKLIDSHLSKTHDKLILVMDQHQQRTEMVRESAQAMFGSDEVRTLIELPFQVESHLYQTLQCADWICALIGRWAAYSYDPYVYQDFEWAERYFGDRIRSNHQNSNINKRRQTSAPTAMYNAFKTAHDAKRK